MPVKIVKYACNFRCGAKVFNTIKACTEHEKLCTNNPVNKACRTCSNQIYEREEITAIRGCKINLLNDLIEDGYDVLKRGMQYHVRPLYLCPNHNQSEPVPELSEYISKLQNKFTFIRKKINDFQQDTDITFFEKDFI